MSCCSDITTCWIQRIYSETGYTPPFRFRQPDPSPMSALVFRLRNVPREEAEEVRALLTEHNIDWYETTAGSWGIAMPGLWLNDEAELPRARELIDAYQRERSVVQRRNHERERQNGDSITLMQRIGEQPLKVAGIVVFCLFILYVSINPFLKLIGYGL